MKEFYAKYKQEKTKNSHLENIHTKLSENISDILEDCISLGAAYIIAHVLEKVPDKWTNSDIKVYLKKTLDNNKKIKDYAYDIMKDLNNTDNGEQK